MDERYFIDYMPIKIWVCHCEQCRYLKNKCKKRKMKKKVKRNINTEKDNEF